MSYILSKLKSTSIGENISERLRRTDSSADKSVSVTGVSHSSLHSAGGEHHRLSFEKDDPDHHGKEMSPMRSHSRQSSSDTGTSIPGGSPARERRVEVGDGREHQGGEESRADSTFGGDISADSDIYETQLNQLQEQLLNTMLEKQKLVAELQTIKADTGFDRYKKDLVFERKRNKDLSVKLSRFSQRPGSSSPGGRPRDIGIVQSEDGKPAGAEPVSQRDNSLASRVWGVFWDRLLTLAEDFSVTAEDMQEEELAVTPLDVKRLKGNVGRFTDEIEPVFHMAYGLRELVSWKQPLLTLTIFMVYLYATYRGYLIPLLLLILVVRITLNYFEETKLVRPIWLLPRKETKATEDRELGYREKFNIVISVATRVQNTLGDLADAMEKIRNLFCWKQRELTKQIFIPLLFVFLISCVVNLDFLMTLFGLGLGLKLFIIDNIYEQYPLVRAKYDSTATLWKELLTDDGLKKIEKQKDIQKMMIPSPTAAALKKSPSQDSHHEYDEPLSDGDKAFCERFELPYAEHPVKCSGFKEGKRCLYIDKDNITFSSALTGHGRLYLTHSFLCYEQSNGKVRKTIALANITRMEKIKPISFMPGQGMALEFSVTGFDKPHIFGGFLNRDELYAELMVVGAGLGLQYTKDCGTADPERTSPTGNHGNTTVRLSELTKDAVEEDCAAKHLDVFNS